MIPLMKNKNNDSLKPKELSTNKHVSLKRWRRPHCIPPNHSHHPLSRRRSWRDAQRAAACFRVPFSLPLRKEWKNRLGASFWFSRWCLSVIHRVKENVEYLGIEELPRKLLDTPVPWQHDRLSGKETVKEVFRTYLLYAKPSSPCCLAKGNLRNHLDLTEQSAKILHIISESAWN